MAGLIAGPRRDADRAVRERPGVAYRGIAPDARIVSLKVATADGGADVSQVIAAIDWVVQHAHDPGLNIRVINLSYGTNSTQAYGVDPLAYAAEQAWKHGIVVVAAAGNTGYQRGNGAPGLADPAYDPYVIAVGRVGLDGHGHDRGRRASRRSRPARGLRLLQEPRTSSRPARTCRACAWSNSWLDVNHPEGQLDDRYFRGSGTSEAAAVTSGAVALVLQRYPTMTPDLVKRFFQTNARQARELRQPGSGSRRDPARPDAQRDAAVVVHGQTFADCDGHRARSSLPAARTT